MKNDSFATSENCLVWQVATSNGLTQHLRHQLRLNNIMYDIINNDFIKPFTFYKKMICLQYNIL